MVGIYVHGATTLEKYAICAIDRYEEGVKFDVLRLGEDTEFLSAIKKRLSTTLSPDLVDLSMLLAKEERIDIFSIFYSKNFLDAIFRACTSEDTNYVPLVMGGILDGDIYRRAGEAGFRFVLNEIDAEGHSKAIQEKSYKGILVRTEEPFLVKDVWVPKDGVVISELNPCIRDLEEIANSFERREPLEVLEMAKGVLV